MSRTRILETLLGGLRTELKNVPRRELKRMIRDLEEAVMKYRSRLAAANLLAERPTREPDEIISEFHSVERLGPAQETTPRTGDLAGMNADPGKNHIQTNIGLSQQTEDLPKTLRVWATRMNPGALMARDRDEMAAADEIERLRKELDAVAWQRDNYQAAVGMPQRTEPDELELLKNATREFIRVGQEFIYCAKRGSIPGTATIDAWVEARAKVVDYLQGAGMPSTGNPPAESLAKTHNPDDPIDALGAMLDAAGAKVYVKEPSKDDPTRCVHGNLIAKPCAECRARVWPEGDGRCGFHAQRCTRETGHPGHHWFDVGGER